METSDGITVTLLLVDGSPRGLLTGEIMSRTIHVLVAPRSRLGEAIKREQARKPGVYFLVGDEPEPPQKQQVYIGEADVVADRIKSHANDESKDFFERFCLITSKDENLNKAHVRYLESRLLEIAKESGLADLKNVNEPQKKNLSGPEVAYMESYLKDIACFCQLWVLTSSARKLLRSHLPKWSLPTAISLSQSN
jgi:hypothetical protein